jgi:ClpP class serine protease
MPWLLSNEAIEEAYAVRKDLLLHSAEAQRAYLIAKSEGRVKEGAASVSAARDDGVTEILVEGVLTRDPLACAWMTGEKNTAYSAIIAALDEAKADANVKSVLLRIDSPGGNVDGLFEALAAIQAFNKPMSVVATMACSAAYAIAAAAGNIQAVNAASMFGSIGVAASLRRDPAAIDLTSTEAPDKRPDVRTDEGKAVIVRHLDAIHDLFVGAIADGRGVTADRVNAEFGRGATLLAGEALSKGMIDSVVKPPERKRVNGRAAAADGNQTIDAAASGEESDDMAMDMKTLRASHPELCAEIESAAVAQERDRVGAHLTMGEASGDLKTALTAVRDGSAMTQTLQAQYLMAGMNRSDRNARQAESDAVGPVVDNAKGKDEGSSLSALDQAVNALTSTKKGGDANG